MNSSTSRSPNTATRTPAKSSTSASRRSPSATCGVAPSSLPQDPRRRGDQVVGDQRPARRCGAGRRSRSTGRSRCERECPARRPPAPACTSVHLSPTANERDEIEPRSAAALRSIPGPACGSRSPSESARTAAWDGADSSRSRRCGRRRLRPVRRRSPRGRGARTASSYMPRPTPDWFVMMTTANPARLSRRTASTA